MIIDRNIDIDNTMKSEVERKAKKTIEEGGRIKIKKEGGGFILLRII